jgi:dTDP-4-amino-4,6-dideoxygalactose transaminase
MIPLFKVHTPRGIGKKLQEVFNSGFLTEGEYSDKFEKEFGNFIGNENTCLVNSCTSALVLASRVIGIQPGDEVITSAMTCMATNEPFYNDGGKLVFADIDPTTGNIDPKDVKNKITSKTKAIVAVHWAGQPFDIGAINRIAKPKGIKVVEDAAHALGATYKGQKIGSHSDFVCFSFQAIKHLTTADGGAIACASPEDAERIRKIRWFGLDRKFKGSSRWQQDITESGFKMHMNNLNAAIGLEQMKTIDKLIRKHKSNGRYYDKKINNDKVVKLRRPRGRVSSHWIYSVLVDDKEGFEQHMKSRGIATDVVHVRNDKYTVFQKFKQDNPGLDSFESRLMNIPVGWWLTREDRDKIVEAVNDY